MEESNTFILDSSFILAYLLPDEDAEPVQQFFTRLKTKDVKLLSSPLLAYEVFNGLKTAVMRKRVKLTLAKNLGRKFLQLPVELIDLDFLKVLEIANKHGLTFYDAIYLYLAKSQKASLLTLDNKLKNLS